MSDNELAKICREWELDPENLDLGMAYANTLIRIGRKEEGEKLIKVIEAQRNDEAQVQNYQDIIDGLICNIHDYNKFYILRLLNGNNTMPEMEVFTSKKEAFLSIRVSVPHILNTIDLEFPRRAEKSYDKAMNLSRRKKHPIAIMTAFNEFFKNTKYEIEMDLIEITLK